MREKSIGKRKREKVKERERERKSICHAEPGQEKFVVLELVSVPILHRLQIDLIQKRKLMKREKKHRSLTHREIVKQDERTERERERDKKNEREEKILKCEIEKFFFLKNIFPQNQI